MRISRMLGFGSALLSMGLWAQGPAGAPPSSTLKVGDQAPDFTLPWTEREDADASGGLPWKKHGGAGLFSGRVHRWLNGRNESVPGWYAKVSRCGRGGVWH